MDATVSLIALPDRRSAGSRDQVVHSIRAEFEEMPCLRLTQGQARRLFGLRADVCERVLSSMVEDGTLVRGCDERYGLRSMRGAGLGPAADNEADSKAS